MIERLLLKKQQVQSAMATLEMDKLSRQEKRKDILTSLVDNVLSSLDEADEAIVDNMKGEGLDIMKAIDKSMRLASSVEEENLSSVKKEIDMDALNDFTKNAEVSLNVNEPLLEAARDTIVDALFLSTPAIHPHYFFFQMPERNVHFESRRIW